MLCGAKLVQQQILKDYGLINNDYEDVIIISQFILFGIMLMAVFMYMFYYLF